MTPTGPALRRDHLRELTVLSVVELASALHERVYEKDPEKFPQAYNVALQLVNDGVVKVLVDGQPGFSLPGATGEQAEPA